MTQPTSIRLANRLKARLKHWAKADARPLSVQIVWILERWCEWREAQETKK